MAKWIRAILASARSSVLIIRSPSFEFQLSRGIRQGDPISPFLFLIGMEAFSVMMERAADEGDSDEDVKMTAKEIGCQNGKIPCIYLGLMIGANMNKIAHWQPVMEVFKKRLAIWKKSTLLEGGRLTLIKPCDMEVEMENTKF
ncbi:uncharacterized protein LOC110896448 [Helianthus annuus]|uniref:uncharacterized protein LOC110896448 n=1 Tax=Helianthus annuus TaxID=4232 RepID=UPI000B8F3034|nr:uncharacterized protein LOC110896448 [Helianthus annuus]